MTKWTTIRVKEDVRDKLKKLAIDKGKDLQDFMDEKLRLIKK